MSQATKIHLGEACEAPVFSGESRRHKDSGPSKPAQFEGWPRRRRARSLWRHKLSSGAHHAERSLSLGSKDASGMENLQGEGEVPKQ